MAVKTGPWTYWFDNGVKNEEVTFRNGKKCGAGVRLTASGRMMARIPLDPRLSRMLIEARDEGCVEEIAVLAAVLSTQDPRERPADKTTEAGRAHAAFNRPHSDFITLLEIWNRFRQAYAQPPAGFKPATWTTTVATIERAVTDAEARMAAGRKRRGA